MEQNISDVEIVYMPNDVHEHMKHNELVKFLKESNYSDNDVQHIGYNWGRLVFVIYDEMKGEPKDVYEEAEMCGARPY